MNKQISANMIVAILLVLTAAVSRVVMYPDNFSPIIGMALFSGSVLANRKLAFAMPILAMFISDILFEVLHIAPGFWGWGQLVGYGILALITVFAFNLKKITVPNLAIFSVSSSLIFYVLSNLSFFLIDNPVYHTYTQDGNGLVQCYVAALPFLKTSLIADLVYTGVLFGAYQLYKSVSANRQLAS